MTIASHGAIPHAERLRLLAGAAAAALAFATPALAQDPAAAATPAAPAQPPAEDDGLGANGFYLEEIGRASGRERV